MKIILPFAMRLFRYFLIVFSFIGWTSIAQLQQIDVGGSPNMEDGDPPRTAWTKQNQNNQEMYGLTSVLAFGARGDGKTDDTLAFSNALYTAHNVYVPNKGSNGYVIGNLVLTNWMTLASDGARLIFSTNYTGAMISFGIPVTNNSGTFATNGIVCGATVRGLELDGGNGTNIPPSLGNRHGIWFQPYGNGNRVKDCYIHGFTGAGIFSQNFLPQSGFNWPCFDNEDIAKGTISGLVVATNWCGIALMGGRTLPPYDDGNDTYLGEYQTLNGDTALYNRYGLWLAAGNCAIGACNFSRNYINVWVDGTRYANNSHGSITGCTLNHSDFGLGDINGIVFTNADNAFLIDNCQIWFDSVQVESSLGVKVNNSVIADGGFNVHNATNCTVENCILPSFSGVLTLLSGTTLGCGGFNNRNMTNGAVVDTLGQFTMGTNSWPPTFATLGANNTNQLCLAVSNSAANSGMWLVGFDAASNTVYKAHFP